MNISSEELRHWARDFANQLDQRGSALALFQNTISLQPNRDFQRYLAAVQEVAALGLPFSRAMALFPEVFEEELLAVVRYGEIYGELDQTLRRYADKPEEMARPCGVPGKD